MNRILMANQIYVSIRGKMQGLSRNQGTFHYTQETMICSSLIQEPILKEYYSLQAWQPPGARMDMLLKSEKGVERISITKDAELSNQNTRVIAGKAGMGSQLCKHRSA